MYYSVLRRVIRNSIEELYMNIYIKGNTQFLWKTIFISKVCIETNVYGEGSNELRASTSKKIILHPM